MHSPSRTLLAVGGALLLLLASASPAAAQDAEDLRVFIERNADLLAWAGDLVGDTESRPARTVLEEARRLHRLSLDLLAREQYVLSFGAARRSRTAVWHAVRLGREAINLEERVRLREERFRDLHGQLRERAVEAGDERAGDLLRQAEQQAVRAHERFLEGDARLALRLLEQAEALTHRAAGLLAEAGGPDRLDQEIERTAELIERVRAGLGPAADPQAGDLLEQAVRSLDEARRHREQGRPGQALQLAVVARRQAGRAGALDEGRPDPETVRRQLDRWDDRFAELGTRLPPDDPPRLRDLLDQALRHRRQAGERLRQGEPGAALRQIRAAHDLLNQADELLR